MKNIDITMTATLRPKVLRYTLESLKENIIRDDSDRYTLLMNVDRIGEDVEPKSMYSVACKYFKNVIVNYPETPSFTKAVIWCWKQVREDYTFHIEDDWQFNRRVDVDHLIYILEKYSDLSSLRLNKKLTPNETRFKVYNGYWSYIEEDRFYIMSEEDTKSHISLNPILFKSKFIKEVLPYMKNDINPEKQLHPQGGSMLDVMKKWRYGVYSNPGDAPWISDTGRIWRKNTNLKKPTSFSGFTTWKKK
jgi:hypothetical protein